MVAAPIFPPSMEQTREKVDRLHSENNLLQIMDAAMFDS
jgi:hypothetical protein